MKISILLYLVFGAALLLSGCSEDNSMVPGSDQNEQGSVYLKSTAKPSANLRGEMDLYFTFGQWPEEPVWAGTIDLEGYGVYGMRFYHLSEFKEYSQASPFEEYFEIFTLTADETVVLAGPDVGITTLANKPPEPTRYRMNGEIEVAIEPFEGWLGRNVHMSGVITWQVIPGVGPVPDTAPGKFRIN